MIGGLSFLKGWSQDTRCDNCLDSISWIDSEGAKKIVVQVIRNGQIGKAGWNNKIVASFSLGSRDSIFEVNRIKEAASLMTGIFYTKKTIYLADFNKDGIKEAYFFYEVEKDGLDDNSLKLICFYRKNKLVVAGNVPKQSEREGLITFLVKGTQDVPKMVIKNLSDLWSIEAKKRMKEYIAKWE
jgi:hypothetical protein